MKSTLLDFMAELVKYATAHPEMLDKPIQIYIPDFIERPGGYERCALTAIFGEKGDQFLNEETQTKLYLFDSKEELG